MRFQRPIFRKESQRADNALIYRLLLLVHQQALPPRFCPGGGIIPGGGAPPGGIIGRGGAARGGAPPAPGGPIPRAACAAPSFAPACKPCIAACFFSPSAAAGSTMFTVTCPLPPPLAWGLGAFDGPWPMELSGIGPPRARLSARPRGFSPSPLPP